jgi:hypothetical protein
VVVALQGCVIVALQGCVIVPLHARLRDCAMLIMKIAPASDRPSNWTKRGRRRQQQQQQPQQQQQQNDH